MQYVMYFLEKAPTRVMKIGINDTFGESGPALELLEEVWTGYRQYLCKDQSVCL